MAGEQAHAGPHADARRVVVQGIILRGFYAARGKRPRGDHREGQARRPDGPYAPPSGISRSAVSPPPGPSDTSTRKRSFPYHPQY